MQSLSLIVGNGFTADESASSALQQFNTMQEEKSVIRLETVYGNGAFTTLIWFVEIESMMQQPPVQRFIGMPLGADPLNPT